MARTLVLDRHLKIRKVVLLFTSVILSGVLCLPQQIFIPGLELATVSSDEIVPIPSEPQPQQQPAISESENLIDINKQSKTNTQARINMLPYSFNEDQLNDLFDIFNANKMNQYQAASQPADAMHSMQQQQQQLNQNFAPNFDYYNSFNINNIEPTTTTPFTTTTVTTTLAPTTTSTPIETTSATTTEPTAKPLTKILYFQTPPPIVANRPFYVAQPSIQQPIRDESSKEHHAAMVYGSNQPFALPSNANEYFPRTNKIATTSPIPTTEQSFRLK